MSTTGFPQTITRVEPLALVNFGRAHWQFADISDGRQSQVGPIYRTKLEALADLERYAIDGGWVKG